VSPYEPLRPGGLQVPRTPAEPPLLALAGELPEPGESPDSVLPAGFALAPLSAASQAMTPLGAADRAGAAPRAKFPTLSVGQIARALLWGVVYGLGMLFYTVADADDAFGRAGVFGALVAGLVVFLLTVAYKLKPAFQARVTAGPRGLTLRRGLRRATVPWSDLGDIEVITGDWDDDDHTRPVWVCFDLVQPITAITPSPTRLSPWRPRTAVTWGHDYVASLTDGQDRLRPFSLTLRHSAHNTVTIRWYGDLPETG
jgi:hypothetical protein